MATSKVLSIALFVLLGLSMCSATRKLNDNRGFEDLGGGLPGGVDPDRDGFQPLGGHLPVPNEEESGGLPGVGSGGRPGVPGEGLPVNGGLKEGLLNGVLLVGGLVNSLPIVGGILGGP